MSDALESSTLFATLLHKGADATHKRLHKKLRHANSDVTVEQFSLLVCLWKSDGCLQQTLAEGTCRDKGSIVRLVDNLEKRSLVVRVPCPDDRRGNRIYLTHQGKSLQSEYLSILDETIKEALRDLSEEKVAVCAEILSGIIENLND